MQVFITDHHYCQENSEDGHGEHGVGGRELEQLKT